MPNNPFLDPNADSDSVKDELLSLSSAFRDATDSILSSIRKVNAQQGTHLDKTLTNSIYYTKQIDKYYNSALSNVGKGIKGELQRRQLAGEIVKIEKLSRNLHSEIRSIDAQALISTGAKQQELLKISSELKNQEDHLQDIAGLQKRELDHTDDFVVKKLQPLIGMFEGLRRIPIFGNIVNPQRGIEKMEDAAKAGKGLFETFGAGMKGAFSGIGSIASRIAIMLGVVTAITGAIKFFVNSLFMADKQITSLAKNLMVSKDTAVGLRKVFIEFGRQNENIYFTTANMIEAQTKLNELFKVGSIFRKDVLENQITLTKEIGLSDEEASNLNKTFILNNQEANKGRIGILDQVAALKNQKGILLDGRNILREVSRVSGQIAVFYKNQLESISKAVVQTQVLGLSLEQAKNMGMGLLDFQSSIENELEAELLLGKELNLEKARGLALQGKVAEASKELMGQVGKLKDFQDLNVIQQNALAKSIGLSSDELSDALVKQEFLVGATKQQYNALVEIGKQKEADALLNEVSTGKSLDAALRSLEVQDRFNQALEKAKEIFSNLINSGVLDKLVGYLEKAVNLVSRLSGSDNNQVNEINKKIQGSDIDKTIKAKAEELVNKIELNSIGPRERLLKEYSPVKYLNKFLGGESVGETDARKDSLINELKDLKIDKPKEDFIMRGDTVTPFRKDDIIMGGTNLLGGNKESQEILSIMKELLNEIKKGGVVIMDGQKVGTALMMGSYKSA